MGIVTVSLLDLLEIFKGLGSCIGCISILLFIIDIVTGLPIFSLPSRYSIQDFEVEGSAVVGIRVVAFGAVRYNEYWIGGEKERENEGRNTHSGSCDMHDMDPTHWGHKSGYHITMYVLLSICLLQLCSHNSH